MYRQFQPPSSHRTSVSPEKVVEAEEEFRLPPFRPLSDFITQGTWNIPGFSDIERFNHRVVNNLIYYQTNYCALGLAVIFLIGYDVSLLT